METRYICSPSSAGTSAAGRTNRTAWTTRKRKKLMGSRVGGSGAHAIQHGDGRPAARRGRRGGPAGRGVGGERVVLGLDGLARREAEHGPDRPEGGAGHLQRGR